jgi:hypothetical protein
LVRCDGSELDKVDRSNLASARPRGPVVSWSVVRARLQPAACRSPARTKRGRQNTTKHDKLRQNTTSGSPARRWNGESTNPFPFHRLRPLATRPPSAFSASCPMILPTIILPSISPAARVFAPFLHHFCTMKWNSKLYRTTPGTDTLNTQPIVSERVASKHGSAKTIFGKEKVKFWMLHQPLTQIGTEDGQQKVKKR